MQKKHLFLIGLLFILSITLSCYAADKKTDEKAPAVTAKTEEPKADLKKDAPSCPIATKEDSQEDHVVDNPDDDDDDAAAADPTDES